MLIAMIGAGSVGATLGQRFAERHDVVFGVRDPTDVGDRAAAMLVCGDDADARTTALDLATELGFEPVDCGPLRIARLLEPMATLWIHLALFQGLGPTFAFGILRR